MLSIYNMRWFDETKIGFAYRDRNCSRCRSHDDVLCLGDELNESPGIPDDIRHIHNRTGGRMAYQGQAGKHEERSSGKG